jgi:serine/threonine-protein kinase PRP4
MASTTSSHSEGEISTSDSEKASQTLPSRNGISVDRHTRTTASFLRAPRSRSRSPYRAPRGEKRRRDDGYADIPADSKSRPHKVGLNSDRHISKQSYGQQPHNDSDLRAQKRRHHAHDYEGNRRHLKRPRTRSRSRSRSRSPFRHSNIEAVGRDGVDLDRSKLEAPEQNVLANRKKNGHGNEQSVSARSKPSGVASALKSNAKLSEYQSSLVDSEHNFAISADKYVSHHPIHDGTDPCDSPKDGNSARNEPEIPGFPAALNEAALIEERRKRREALKAKYRNQETPLLVQALHPGTDVNSSASSSVQTPQAAEQSLLAEGQESLSKFSSAEPLSSQTPKEALPSPAELKFDQGENMANSNSGSVSADEDEPSAADYDPTVDMQEERARHDRRLFNEDISVSVEEQKRLVAQDGLALDAYAQLPSQIGSNEPEKHKDQFDMFAEDDDEVDMFAEASSKPDKPISISHPDTKNAQSLDATMMDNWDDPDGYYMTIPGELFESRYHVLQNLGRGMFSSVVRATDTKTNKLVAIKIVRNNDTMRKAGIKEIEILRDLAANDPEDKKHLIRLERSFEHKGHLCMVFENLSLNLREVLKKFGRDVGINLKAIRAYAQQLFLSLSLLRKCRYLHADVKPDNILVNEARNVLKVCDLGSASSIEENATAPYLVSRFYRAPEIILGIPYDYGIDVWSIGCTLFELYTGKILFTGRNNNAMLRSMMECRGKFPHKILRKGSLTYQYFDDLLNFQSVEEDKLTGRTVTKMIDIKAKPVKGLRERLVPKGKKMEDQERKEVEMFADLLDKCLDLRGDKRITPSEALRHPFITRVKI